MKNSTHIEEVPVDGAVRLGRLYRVAPGIGAPVTINAGDSCQRQNDAHNLLVSITPALNPFQINETLTIKLEGKNGIAKDKPALTATRLLGTGFFPEDLHFNHSTTASGKEGVAKSAYSLFELESAPKAQQKQVLQDLKIACTRDGMPTYPVLSDTELLKVVTAPPLSTPASARPASSHAK